MVEQSYARKRYNNICRALSALNLQSDLEEEKHNENTKPMPKKDSPKLPISASTPNIERDGQLVDAAANTISLRQQQTRNRVRGPSRVGDTTLDKSRRTKPQGPHSHIGDSSKLGIEQAIDDKRIVIKQWEKEASREKEELALAARRIKDLKMSLHARERTRTASLRGDKYVGSRWQNTHQPTGARHAASAQANRLGLSIGRRAQWHGYEMSLFRGPWNAKGTSALAKSKGSSTSK